MIVQGVRFAAYDADGRIMNTGSAPESDWEKQAPRVIKCGPNIKDTTHYVGGIESGAPTVMQKRRLFVSWDKTQVLADGIEEATLTVLPTPCTVYVDGTATIVDDGSFEFAAADPGVYTIAIDEVQYLRAEWKVQAID